MYSSLKTNKSNIRKTNLKVLQILLDKLHLYQRALRLGYINKNQLIATTQRECYRVFKLEFAFIILETTFKELFSQF